MATAQFHKRLLLIPVFICVFIYADTYLVPRKTSMEFVTDVYQTKERRTGAEYMTTNVDNYPISEKLMNAINRGDTLLFYRSVLTGRHVKVLLDRHEYAFYYSIGFQTAGAGFIWTPVLLIGTLIFMRFYQRVDTAAGRRNGTFAFVILAFVLLFAYLDVKL
jgi:hypothetical protein